MTPVFGVERILTTSLLPMFAKDGFYAMAGCATPKMIGDPWVHGFCGKHLADWLTRVQKNKEASRVCKTVVQQQFLCIYECRLVMFGE